MYVNNIILRGSSILYSNTSCIVILKSSYSLTSRLSTSLLKIFYFFSKGLITFSERFIKTLGRLYLKNNKTLSIRRKPLTRQLMKAVYIDKTFSNENTQERCKSFT